MRIKAGYTDEPTVLDMSQSSAMNTTLNGLVGSGGVMDQPSNLMDTFSKPTVVGSLDNMQHQMSQQSLFEKTELLLKPPNIYRQVIIYTKV